MLFTASTTYAKICLLAKWGDVTFFNFFIFISMFLNPLQTKNMRHTKIRENKIIKKKIFQFLMEHSHGYLIGTHLLITFKAIINK